MCLLQLSCLPQWTRTLPISSRQFHSTLTRRVLSTLHHMDIVAAGREFGKGHMPRLGLSRPRGLKLRTFSLGSNLISPRSMIPKSEVSKKVWKTDLPLYPGSRHACIQVEGSRSMFEVKLFRGKNGGAAELSRWWLQPVRTWNEMCLAGGLPLAERTIILALSEWSSLPTKHFSIECSSW